MLRMSKSQWNVIHTQTQTRMHRSGQMERNVVRSAQVFTETTYKIVQCFLLSKHGGHPWARLILKLRLGMHLQVVVQVAWGCSYMGQPFRVCFWVKPHCPLCCLSKEPRYLHRQTWIERTNRKNENVSVKGGEVKASCKAVEQCKTKHRHIHWHSQKHYMQVELRCTNWRAIKYRHAKLITNSLINWH